MGDSEADATGAVVDVGVRVGVGVRVAGREVAVDVGVAVDSGWGVAVGVGVCVDVAVAVNVRVGVAVDSATEVFVAVGVGVAVFATVSEVHCIRRLKFPVCHTNFGATSNVYAPAGNERIIRELRPSPPSSSKATSKPLAPIPDSRIIYVSVHEVRSI